jgi:hypothetical protein
VLRSQRQLEQFVSTMATPGTGVDSTRRQRQLIASVQPVVFDATSKESLTTSASACPAEKAPLHQRYIPTTTAAVTRNADVASITGSAFSGWYRQDEGTVFSAIGVQHTLLLRRTRNIPNNGRHNSSMATRLQCAANRFTVSYGCGQFNRRLSAGEFSAGVLVKSVCS